MTLRWIAALAAAALLLTSCGGGGTDRTKANVRLVNASSGYAQLDINVDGQGRQGQVSYGTRADYVEIDPGKADTTINRASSATPLLSFTPALSKNRYYTLLAYGGEGTLKQVLLDDNAGAPDTNRALLRVVNAAADAGALDIYLTGGDETLAASVPVQAAAAVGTVNGWLTVSSGNWRLRVTAAGSKTDVRLDMPLLALASKEIATLVLAAGRGGVLVNALVLDQQAAIGRLDGTMARVRVAAGVANGAVVAVNITGSGALLPATASPVIGLYTLLPVTASVAVTVNGTAITPGSFTLLAGGDYTLLVYSASSGATANWIEDDNRLPTDLSQARLRLVNGVSTTSAALSMTLDLTPAASNVTPGTASAYALVQPTTTGKLAVSAAGDTAPLFTAVDQVLVAGGNYSVFVLGAAGSASAPGTLRKDR